MADGEGWSSYSRADPRPRPPGPLRGCGTARAEDFSRQDPDEGRRRRAAGRCGGRWRVRARRRRRGTVRRRRCGRRCPRRVPQVVLERDRASGASSQRRPSARARARSGTRTGPRRSPVTRSWRMWRAMAAFGARRRRGTVRRRRRGRRRPRSASDSRWPGSDRASSGPRGHSTTADRASRAWSAGSISIAPGAEDDQRDVTARAGRRGPAASRRRTSSSPRSWASRERVLPAASSSCSSASAKGRWRSPARRRPMRVRPAPGRPRRTTWRSPSAAAFRIGLTRRARVRGCRGWSPARSGAWARGRGR